MNPKVVKWNANGPMLRSEKTVYCDKVETKGKSTHTILIDFHNAEQASYLFVTSSFRSLCVHKTICLIECVSLHLLSNPSSNPSPQNSNHPSPPHLDKPFYDYYLRYNNKKSFMPTLYSSEELPHIQKFSYTESQGERVEKSLNVGWEINFFHESQEMN